MVNVPSMEDFNSLVARVAKLEPSSPGGGMQAKRSAALCEILGANTFSASDANPGGVWGAWPSDFRAQTVIAARNQLIGASGYNFRYREYHYAGRTSFQKPWLQAVTANGDRAIMCLGDNGSLADVQTMIDMANDPTCGLDWVEGGGNEPNWDNGTGKRPLALTQAIQAAVWNAIPDKTVGPSIVAGMPGPAGWVNAYVPGAALPALNAQMKWGNAHDYPPGSPDDTFAAYIAELSRTYGGKRMMTTEVHPSLFLQDVTKRPGGENWSGTRDAYYLLRMMLIAVKSGIVDGIWWYPFFDYGTRYLSGMFPRDATNPRPVVKVLHALYNICSDQGATKRTFTPGKLDITLPTIPGTDADLFQSSDGRFFLPVSRLGPDPGGSPIDYPVIFNKPPSNVMEYNLLSETPTIAVQSIPTPASIKVALDVGVRILSIQP